jgi:hypothetical protein
MALTYTVRWGGDKGTVLKPHLYRNKGFRAFESKFGPQVHVRTEAELIPFLRKGWLIRMSANGHPPSGIKPESVNGWR